MQALITTIVNFFTNLFLYLDDFAQSIKDFITDLPAILLEYATNFILHFLTWAGSMCSYCLGGDGSGSGSISVFAQSLQEAYDALSPCVVYALTMSGISGCLQILSCAMVVWSAFRVAALVRSIA
jgi:hypothetical protein